MKKNIKGAAKLKPFSSKEAIRVVPLHQPAMAAAAKPHLSYRGGSVLSGVEVFTIFWGSLWDGSVDLINKLNQFFQDIVVSPIIDQLAEYSVPGGAIGHGSFVGTKTIAANAPGASITDTAIRKRLKSWIVSKTIPTNNPNSLYFIYLDPGVVSIMGGSRSCHSYCGYHNNAASIYYAIMPYPGCMGCLGGLQVFDALTGTSSHELCEAITDPVPGAGWYDDVNGEIGDICAWTFKQVAGYTVQMEWSNQQNKCL